MHPFMKILNEFCDEQDIEIIPMIAGSFLFDIIDICEREQMDVLDFCEPLTKILNQP